MQYCQEKFRANSYYVEISVYIDSDHPALEVLFYYIIIMSLLPPAVTLTFFLYAELGTLEWITFNPNYLIRISTVETFNFSP